MRLATLGLTASCAFILCGSAWATDWVTLSNETSTRLVSAPGLGSTDPEEKDYATADLNQDGWTDLVVVRKQPFTSAGKRANVLFMNEEGVLTDRTALYASASDVAGDQGFLTPTNDRDVVIDDVNLDGWLDVVTATTISDGFSKEIGHPRVYINLGNDLDGNWLGLRYEADRFPQLTSVNGTSTASGNDLNPRFCSVAIGDVTGDGYPDLYFGDYDSSGAGGAGESGGNSYDMDNRLLINQGAANPGVFVDESTIRMGPNPFDTTSNTQGWLNSAFGAASVIADMNGDGVNDVIKQTSLQTPTHIAIHWNNPDDQGMFEAYETFYSLAPYFVTAGDLNNDGKLDMVITDDNTDRYLLNSGNGADGFANFSTHQFPASTAGFGSQSVIADLNNDGWNDVLIADVDVDISGCNRVSEFLRNNGNPPTVTFTQDLGVGGLANTNITGVHNFAVFDINNDCWLDVVIGKCSGTQVWMNVPPAGEACEPKDTCPADFTDDGLVDGADLGQLLLAFGSPGENADLNGDGIVDGADLGELLLAFGACP
jgi:hypothetical protein